MTYFREKVGCEVITSDDGNSFGWTCEGKFCGESGSTYKCSGQAMWIPKCTFVASKATTVNAVTQL